MHYFGTLNGLPRVLAIVCVFFAALLGAPQRTLGASASVSAAPQANGGVIATATGSFASCVVCDARDGAGNCTQSHTTNYGSIALYLEGSLRCSAGGNGAASCTSLEDRGLLHGTHVFSATASDCVGSASSSFTLTLDNTPTVAVTGPSGVVSGPFDITGTATFKPTLSPTKGYPRVVPRLDLHHGEKLPHDDVRLLLPRGGRAVV